MSAADLGMLPIGSVGMVMSSPLFSLQLAGPMAACTALSTSLRVNGLAIS